MNRKTLVILTIQADSRAEAKRLVAKPPLRTVIEGLNAKCRIKDAKPVPRFSAVTADEFKANEGLLAEALLWLENQLKLPPQERDEELPVLMRQWDYGRKLERGIPEAIYSVLNRALPEALKALNDTVDKDRELHPSARAKLARQEITQLLGTDIGDEF
jgi:hypothetical protein